MKNGRNGVETNGMSHVHEPTFQDYFRTILREKRIILTSFLTVFTAAALYAFFSKPVYESTAAVLVDTKQQQMQLQMFDLMGVAGVKNIKNELEILQSRSLAEDVAKRLIALKHTDSSQEEEILIIQPPEDKEEAARIPLIAHVVENLEEDVEFEPVRESDVIKITAQSTQAREAALIVNTYAQAYYDRNLYTSRTRSRAVREFLEEQLVTRKTSLDQSETALLGYMETKEIVSLDEEAKKVIEQLATLEAQRDGINISLGSLERTLVLLQEELTRLEPKVAKAIGEANDTYIRSLQEKLAELEVRRDVSIAQAAAQNPTITGQSVYNQTFKEYDDQINTLRQNLQKRTDEYLASLIPGERKPGVGNNDPTNFVSELKARIIEAQILQQEQEAKKRALSTVIMQYEKRFESIPEKHIEYARLQRTRLSNEKLYLFVEEKFNEAAITEKSEFGYIDIIDPAVVEIEPIRPKKLLSLILGAILGIGLGAGIVFVREFLDMRVRVPDDLKKRGMPLLTTVALMNEEIQKLNGAGKIENNGVEVDAHLVTLFNPLSTIAESFRRLRTNIQYAQLDTHARVILVTSSNPGEGKSTIASNLAITFAQTGKKVLLIDCDLRKPTLHSEFGVERGLGITELLVGTASFEKVVRKTPAESLDLICSGGIPPNPAEMLGSNKMKDLLEKFRSRYDYILLDSPPVLAVTDPVILSTIADGVVVVVSADSTRMEALERTTETLGEVGTRLIGFVLNNFDFRNTGGYYSAYENKKYGLAVELGYAFRDANNSSNGGHGRGNGHHDKEREKETPHKHTFKHKG
ncbi:MAG: polysaccharide biosynthesis tyrosine autokinase [Ignavibacteriae bacterium]|nr:polysaccharide biosynthesis tyrosine autokinase [Ignavibacteriota bacterium]